jgi:solute carrier family 6 amino acid transporter-like protein 5/7/9/14
MNGIIYYLKPDFSKLGDLQVWGEASAQAFASLSLGGGGWITLSSYNKFKNRCDRDSFLVGIGNALTSIYSGFVIFSVLGYMAYIKGVSMDHVTAKGPGLAFVAYPEGLALIPGAPLWAICFFVMMFTVGLDSLFGQVETIIGSIIDEFPEFLRPRRRLFTLFVCFIMFLMGIPLITQGGIFIVTLLDWYTLLFSFSIISLCELVAIMYIYGYKRFSEDIKMMVGSKPPVYFTICWLVISPITLLCVIAFLAAQQHINPPVYGDYNFPAYAQRIGLALALGPAAIIPLTALAIFFWKVPLRTIPKLFTDPESREKVKTELLCPAADWGPALPEMFRKYSEAHGKGLPTDEAGEDEVFGQEMGEVKPTKVKFSDENQPDSENHAGDHNVV